MSSHSGQFEVLFSTILLIKSKTECASYIIITALLFKVILHSSDSSVWMSWSIE